MHGLRKIKTQSGFTLAETLLAVLILLLVSGIVATGIPVAQNVYEKVILGANAQVMLSTAITALKSELGTAWDMECEKDHSITYYSAKTGNRSQIKIEEGGTAIPIQLTEYYSTTNKVAYALVADPSSKMCVICSRLDVDVDNSIVIFNGIQVCKLDNSGKPGSLLAKLEGSLKIQAVSGKLKRKSVPDAGGEES